MCGTSLMHPPIPALNRKAEQFEEDSFKARRELHATGTWLCVYDCLSVCLSVCAAIFARKRAEVSIP